MISPLLGLVAKAYPVSLGVFCCAPACHQLAPAMQRQIAQFLTYMRVERGASDYTVKSYREDLIAAADYFSEEDGTCPAPVPRRAPLSLT